MAEYHLDDRYTNGIWYDTMNGDFCEIQESADGELVELVNPETQSVYWDMPVSTWVESEQHDFRQVSKWATFDPVDTVRSAIRKLMRGNMNELSKVSHQERIDLRYAFQQVEISEK